MKLLGLVVAAVASAAMLFCAAPASADPPPPGCQRTPILGLNPSVQEICDLAVQPDGSWERWRWSYHPEYVNSTCGQYGGFVDGQYRCPPWAPKDVSPYWETPVDKYVVTPDTVPEGEPGHIDAA